MDEPIMTGRMRLRRFGQGDEGLLFELDSDPHVMRWLSGGAGTPMEVVERTVLPGFIAASARFRELGYRAAFDRVSGTFVGWFGVRPTDAEGAIADLGYRLRRDAWGRGLATEGARAMLAAAFGRPELIRVTGTTFEHNAASRRVMEKAGMALIRRYRPSSGELAAATTYDAAAAEPWDGDDLEYAIERGEWERLAARSSP